MEKWQRRTEILSNIAFVACCVLFAIFLVKTYLFTSTKQDAKTAIASLPSLVGKKLSIDNIDSSNNQQTLLIILQRGCRFCEESVPFYQRLTKELSNQTRTHLIAVFPPGDVDSKQYLKDKMIDIADVRQIAFRSIGVQGTPTLIMLDNTGTVLEQWVGRLPTAEEDAVILRLKQS